VHSPRRRNGYDWLVAPRGRAHLRSLLPRRKEARVPMPQPHRLPHNAGSFTRLLVVDKLLASTTLTRTRDEVVY
jgi:hypothetical protein